MRQKGWILQIILILLFLRGCASIVSSTTQEVTVQSAPEDVLVQ